MYFDDHEPPHFHVRYNDYRAAVSIKKPTGTLCCQFSYVVSIPLYQALPRLIFPSGF